jgi:hypothetical protein
LKTSGFQGALTKINGLITSRAGMWPVELVGEDFLLFAAVGTLAGERRKIFVGLQTGAMIWGVVHFSTPLVFTFAIR